MIKSGQVESGQVKSGQVESHLRMEFDSGVGPTCFNYFLLFLDDVIRDKDAERKKLEEEELEFQQKKRERERKIIQIEKEELDRREDEVSVDHPVDVLFFLTRLG